MDRDLMLPNSALLGALNDMQRRLIGLERRVRYQGQTRLIYEAGGPYPADPVAVIPIQNSLLGSWPTYTTVSTVDLDPGRWAVVAGCTMVPDYGVSPPMGNLDWLWRAQFDSPESSTEAQVVGSVATDMSDKSCVVAGAALVVGAPLQLTIGAAWGVDRAPGVEVMDIFNLYVLLVPG